MDYRDYHYLKWHIHRIKYLKFVKALKKRGLEKILTHNKESYYLARYKEFGEDYLDFLADALKLNIFEIIDKKGFEEIPQCSILIWVFKVLNRKEAN